MNLDWADVRKYAVNQLQVAQRQLETCPHDEIDLVRGRIQAYKQVLRLEESPVADESVPHFATR